MSYIPFFATDNWKLDGNSLNSIKSFGTISNYEIPVITNNTEKIRILSGSWTANLYKKNLSLGVNGESASIISPINSSKVHGITFDTDGSTKFIIADGITSGSTITANPITIVSDGSVGINTISPSKIFQITDPSVNKHFSFGNGEIILSGGTHLIKNITGQLKIETASSVNSSNINDKITLGNQNDTTNNTANEYSKVDIQGGSFNVSSGDGDFNILKLTANINQIGSATGVSRGIYLSANTATVYDYRGIEIANDKGYGLYQVNSTVKNFFGGFVGIGTEDPDIPLNVKKQALSTSVSNFGIGANFQSQVLATNNNHTLVGVEINPDLQSNGNSNIKKYGLRVRNSQVWFDEYGTRGFIDNSPDTIAGFNSLGEVVQITPSGLTNILGISGTTGSTGLAFTTFVIGGFGETWDNQPIVADSAQDTFSFAAGTGILLQTNSPDDRLKISLNSFRPYVVRNNIDYSATTSDYIIYMNVSSGNRTLYLPNGGLTPGLVYTIKKSDTSINTVNIQPFGTQKIDGQNNFILDSVTSCVTIQTFSSNWYILSKVT
jgi:hypothetical protein